MLGVEDAAVTVEWPKLLGWAASSGIAAGLVNQLAGWGREALKGHRDRRLQRDRIAGDAAMQDDRLASEAALQDQRLEAEGRKLEQARSHELAMQADERAHQAQLRREADHAAARDQLLTLAEGVLDWVIITTARTVENDDVFYTGAVEVEPTLKTATEVDRALRKIARSHPSEDVRRLASEFHERVDGAYNWVEMNQLYDDDQALGPDKDELLTWHGRAEGLIAAMHVG